eukprot:TRINITY_DN316_c0_g1_i1.p2 TRINITY_DN316_c0_g1~~TRINITY_DN316_c0_g1_i1.p2  ORF type:complete len:142 (+),score=57.18 TRINITY_DN316_c0_g1_i1:789-1214(+)
MEGLSSEDSIITNFEAIKIIQLNQKQLEGRVHHKAKTFQQSIVDSLPLYLQLEDIQETIEETITHLIPFGLSKTEIMVLINNTPQSLAELYSVIENVEMRFNEQQMENILQNILVLTSVVQEECSDDNNNDNNDEEDDESS